MDHNRIDPHHVRILLNSLRALTGLVYTLNHGECILFVSLSDMLLSTSAGLFKSRRGSQKRDPSPIQKSSADYSVHCGFLRP